MAGVVINDYLLEPPYDVPALGNRSEPPSREPAIRDDTDIAMYHNPEQMALLGKTPVLAIVPREAENSVQNATIGPDTEYNIAQVDWEKAMAEGR